MNTRKFFSCRVCGKVHSSHGFCKYHSWAFTKKKIGADGVPSSGLFYDSAFKLKKEKDSLSRTVKESIWYRDWRWRIIKKYNRRCSRCEKRGIKLIVHHSGKRFSQIIGEAKEKFSDVQQQVLYCKDQHTLDIAVPLCAVCHANAHAGEKMHASLSGAVANGKCKVCGADEYCRKFCSRHYKAFQAKRMDADGMARFPPRLFETKQRCIVCGKESVGYGGKKATFCSVHLSRFYHKMIDINGNSIRELKRPSSCGGEKCKVCGGDYFGKGFCLTHYNRFKIRQININGQEIRPLGVFDRAGKRFPRKLIEFNGEKLSIAECAARIGINDGSMAKRLRKWSVEKALSTPRVDSAGHRRYS